MALIDLDKSLADESEPSLLCVDLSNSSDSSSSIFTDDESEINILLRRRTSISLFNVSTPLESNEERRNRYRSASHYNINSDRKKRKFKPCSSDNETKEEPKTIIENLETEYANALKEIEALQTQINKMKSERSITPLFVRRKSLQSSMIKTCLFKNSIRQNQHNSTKSSLFGADSTCMTIDVENNSPQAGNEIFHEFLLTNNHEMKANPFIIKAASPVSLTNTNYSCDPLISNSHKQYKSRKMSNFISKFIKCPKFLRSPKTSKHNAPFGNKISPIPKVVIVSPKTPENDSGNDSYGHVIRLDDINFNTAQMEKVIKDMSQCAEELSQKLYKFKNVLEQFMNQKNTK